MPVTPRRSETRAEFIATWSPRVGERAAGLAVSSARLVGLGGLLVPVWAVVLVLGSKTIGGVVVATLLIVGDAALLMRGVLLMNLMHRELTERFGTKVRFLDAPSLRDGRFQAWCRGHGVDPESGRPIVRPG